MIDEKKQLCFLHIPKTAGTSFNAMLKMQVGTDEFCELPHWYKIPDFYNDLSKFKIITGHIYHEIELVLPEPPLFLVMLRNPVERFLSHFDQIRRHAADPSSDKWGGWWNGGINYTGLDKMGIDEFVFTQGAGDAIANLQCRVLASSFEPTITRVSDILKAKEVMNSFDINLAKQKLEDCIFVGLTEQMNYSISLLSYTFRWQPFNQIHRLNVSKNKPQLIRLRPETIEKIRQLNEMDIELYTYAEQLFLNRYQQMMDNLLTERFLKSNTNNAQARLKNIFYDFRQSFTRRGWNPVEQQGESRWAWSGPGTVSDIEIPLDRSTDLKIEFKIRFAVALDVLNSLRLMFDGDPVFITKTEIEGGWLFQGVLHKSQEQSNKLDRLSFVVNRTTYPLGVLPSSYEARLLGFALEWIKISPAL